MSKDNPANLERRMRSN